MSTPGCAIVAPWLSAHLDDEVPPNLLDVVRTHCSNCAECGRALAILSCAAQAFRDLRPRPVTPPRESAVHVRPVKKLRQPPE
jgi:predicted anti-sigma-YlaC factor YlaD